MSHYLNNAGAGLMSTQTLDTIVGHLEREMAVGAYHAAQESQLQTKDFYNRAARLINAADPSEIAFTDSASRAWNVALHGIRLGSNDCIVTLSSEFGTNLVTLFHRAHQVGASVKVSQCDLTGYFSLDELANDLDNGASLIAISHAAAHGSIVNPVLEIGKLARQHHAVYLLDGCQAVGQLPVDVDAIQCDAYTATGRKWLRGPRGTGFLYVNPSSPLRASQVDLASADLVINDQSNKVGVNVRKDARQFELWERNVAAMLGLSSAIGEYLQQACQVLSDRICTLANRLRSAVVANSNLNLVGEAESPSGVVGFYLVNHEREGLVRSILEQQGVGISLMHDWDCPLHFPKNGASVIFRLSPHYCTKDSSVDAVCDLISAL